MSDKSVKTRAGDEKSTVKVRRKSATVLGSPRLDAFLDLSEGDFPLVNRLCRNRSQRPPSCYGQGSQS
jgi:hypothetical protein